MNNCLCKRDGIIRGRQENSFEESLNCGTRSSSCLRHRKTSQNVADSIPDGVIGIVHWLNSSGRTNALGSTQLLTQTPDISWDKGGWCLRLTTILLSHADWPEILWTSTCPGVIWNALPWICYVYNAIPNVK